MYFNSLTYLAFMLAIVPVVILSPSIVRKVILLAASLLFYAFWRVDFTVLVVFSGVVDFVCARKVYSAHSAGARKAWLIASLCINLGLLAFFKYTYFVVGTTQSVFAVLGLPFEITLPSILLPLGISFYTFQTISYTIDVYRGRQEPVRDVVLFLTYVTFWPQLVAGPVLRASEVIPQLQRDRRPRLDDMVHGLEGIVQGLFKKVVLADTLAVIVDYGYAQPAAGLGMLDAWTLSFAFGMQIYFDFSGYSQIAIGSARLMGFVFPRNFDWPYLAVSPRQFWKRWHISLSSWIRDYLYLPLTGGRSGDRSGGSGATGSTGGLEVQPERRATARRYVTALFVTWLIMGLWHGASWTFALWGLWHAVLIWLYRTSEPVRTRLWTPLRNIGGWCLTIVLCMLGWTLFRCQTVDQGLAMLAKAFDFGALTTLSMRENSYLITAICFVGLLMVGAVVKLHKHVAVPFIARLPALTLANAVMFFALFLMLRPVKQFIYFQF